MDIAPHFEPDVIADLTNPVDCQRVIDAVGDLHVNVAWASPVCTEFTKAGLPQTWARSWKHPPKPDPALTAACRELIQRLNPDFWIIENVMASRKFLTPLLGPVRAIVLGHVFWGNIPCLLPQTKAHKWRLPPTPDRTELRAKIPYEIGETICRAVEARERHGAP